MTKAAPKQEIKIAQYCYLIGDPIRNNIVMSKKSLLLAIVAIGLGTTIGLLVPILFEVFENPAARSRHPWLERIAIIAFVTTWVIVFLVNRFWPSNDIFDHSNSSRQQFSLRFLFVCLTSAAILLSVAPQLDFGYSSMLIVSCALFSSIAAFSFSRTIGMRALSLHAAMFTPFCWVIAFNKPFGHASGLLEGAPVGPGLIAIFVFGKKIDEAGMAAVMVISLIGIGLWLAFRGRKLYVAFLILVLISSSFQSLLMHIAYRA